MPALVGQEHLFHWPSDHNATYPEALSMHVNTQAATTALNRG
jgi:hypothetical protein